MQPSAPTICALCDAPDALTHLESHQDPGGDLYQLYACTLCEAWFWYPLKNPGGGWYERDERYAGRNEDPILEPNWNHKKVISYLDGKAGKVLDIGCGVGNFLAHAQSKGWECYGIDFDRDAIEAGKRTFGLENLYVADLKEFADSHKGNTFDLITAFDVFEHIDNHREFMTLIRSLLSENGSLAMSMPYRKRAAWLALGDVPPRHLTRWDRSALSHFLDRHGFTTRFITRRSEGLRLLILKLRFKYGKNVSFNLVGRVRNAAVNRSAPTGLDRLKLQLVRMLASTKDTVLFGVPALAIYLKTLFSPSRYITLYVIAEKRALSPSE